MYPHIFPMKGKNGRRAWVGSGCMCDCAPTFRIRGTGVCARAVPLSRLGWDGRGGKSGAGGRRGWMTDRGGPGICGKGVELLERRTSTATEQQTNKSRQDKRVETIVWKIWEELIRRDISKRKKELRGKMARSKRDWVYLVFFLTHLPVMLGKGVISVFLHGAMRWP